MPKIDLPVASLLDWREWLEVFIDKTADALVREEMPWRGQRADPALLSHLLYHALVTGWQEPQLRAWLRQSQEWQDHQHAPPPPLPPPAALSPITAEGRRFFPRALFVSGFALATTQRRDEYLDWVRDTGFNGVRVMLGDLSWANQTAKQARLGLLPLIMAAAARGLYLEVTCLTGTAAQKYNKTEHLDHIARDLQGVTNVLVELANEPYHSSQDDQVHDVTWLRNAGEKHFEARNLPWAVGAARTDEPLADGYPTAFGTYVTAHLRRTGKGSPEHWNMVRRVRELYAIYERHKLPVMNNEPIGWAEREDPGSRTTNASIAFAMGALSRLFDLGLVSHADHGLLCTLPGPVQQRCHDALVDGFKAFPTQASLQYRNVGHSGSPVKDAKFVDEGGKVVRAYSGVHGKKAWVLPMGANEPELELAPGWSMGTTLARRPEIQLLELVNG
jgi:hypothetical protein